MDIFRSLKSLFRRLKRKIRRRLSRTELIIIASFTVGIIIATAIIVVLKITSDEQSSSLNTPIKVFFSKDVADAAGTNEESEELIMIETASSGTKHESTEATTELAMKEGALKGYLNRCVFLGDSRTVAMVNSGLINDDAALAQIGISHPSFSGNTFMNNAGKEYTLKSYLSSHQAPVIYVALGVNGINDPSEDHYKKTFSDLIDKISSLAPNSNIVLMSIGPVDDNGPYRNTVQNSWIKKYNDFLLGLAKEKHIFYLNVAEELTGDNGQVKSEYDAGDGLHYSSSGCQAILDYIVSHPVPGISDDGEYVVHYVKPNPRNTKVTMDDGSGIDEEKLQELMNMMLQNAEPTAAPDGTTPTPVPETPAPQPSEEEHHEEEHHEEEHHEEEHHEEEHHDDEEDEEEEEEDEEKDHHHEEEHHDDDEE